MLWANECMAPWDGASFVMGTNANARVATQEVLNEILVILLFSLSIRAWR